MALDLFATTLRSPGRAARPLTQGAAPVCVTRVTVLPLAGQAHLSGAPRPGRAQVAERAAGREVTVRDGASSGKQSHAFGWRDAMDIPVKWRQLAEPNDQARAPGPAMMVGRAVCWRRSTAMRARCARCARSYPVLAEPSTRARALGWPHCGPRALCSPVRGRPCLPRLAPRQRRASPLHGA
jgi:hypothetical protein